MYNIIYPYLFILFSYFVSLISPSLSYSFRHETHSTIYRSSRPEVFLGKGVLKICSKFTRDHPYRNVISIKLQSNCIEITLRYVCSPVNYLHILRTPFYKNTSGWLLLKNPMKMIETTILCEILT